MEQIEPIAASRQNYSTEVEEAVNQQINRELDAFYQYAALASFFGRAEIALSGAALFFGKQSTEEKEHAQMLIEYQSKRGGKVAFLEIKAPAKQEWSSLHVALLDALEMEKNNNEALLALHQLASSKADADMTNFLEGFYLPQQVEEIDQMTRLANQLMQMGLTGLGVQLFDQQLYLKSSTKKD